MPVRWHSISLFTPSRRHSGTYPHAPTRSPHAAGLTAQVSLRRSEERIELVIGNGRPDAIKALCGIGCRQGCEGGVID